MSRSKRAPYWTEGYKGSWRKKAKDLANARTKREEQPTRAVGAYKRTSNSWDICDYKFHDPESKKVRRK
jgi:hypothetical protein